MDCPMCEQFIAPDREDAYYSCLECRLYFYHYAIGQWLQFQGKLYGWHEFERYKKLKAFW
jgi:hypothetical protein